MFRNFPGGNRLFSGLIAVVTSVLGGVFDSASAKASTEDLAGADYTVESRGPTQGSPSGLAPWPLAEQDADSVIDSASRDWTGISARPAQADEATGSVAVDLRSGHALILSSSGWRCLHCIATATGPDDPDHLVDQADLLVVAVVNEDD